MKSQEFELKTKLKIREAKADDAEDLHLYCFPNEEFEDIKDELSSDLERMADEQVYRLVVDASGHAVANIRMERSPFDSEVGKISRLAVAMPFRGFNIADRLVEGINELAAENEINTIQVDIPKSEEKIIEAYKRWGFSESPFVTLQKEIEAEENEQSEEESVDESEEKEEEQLDLGVNNEKKE